MKEMLKQTPVLMLGRTGVTFVENMVAKTVSIQVWAHTFDDTCLVYI